MSLSVPKINPPEPKIVSVSGPVSFYLFIILTVTGLILFPIYPADYTLAYGSLAPDGGVSFTSAMRGMHRGGAALFVLFMMIHAVRAFVLRKYEKGRWTPFMFGAGLVGFALWQGVTGHIMPMDIRTQSLLSALEPAMTAVFGAEGLRAFLPGHDVSGGVMVIVLAAHLVPPFVAVAALMGHFAPLAEPRLWPSRPMCVAIVAGLALAALIFPVTSLSRADFSKMPGAVPFDWALLFPLPAMAALPGPVFWGGAVSLLALVGLVPYFLTRKESGAVVQIREDDCVGCGLCVKDCPYKALDMLPRPAHSKYPWVVTLEGDKCIDCGVCVGSCGFHALDITRRPVAEIRAEARVAGGNVVAYVCANILKQSGVPEIPGVTVVSIACGGQVYPGWMEDDLRGGAVGVILAVCAPFSCAGRLGSTHESARVGHERRPFLRKRVERGKVGYAWFAPGEYKELARTLTDLADDVRGGVKHADAKRAKGRAVAHAAIAAVSIVVLIPSLDYLWKRTAYALEDPSDSQVIVSFDTHEQCSVKIFFGGKLAVERSFQKSGSIDPVKIAVTARTSGNAPETRVQIIEGAVTTEKAMVLPSGRRAALVKNPVTGEFEFK